ncbi:MAG TPA: transposase [Actinomycetota bacterium]|nr:transposase [Actinomycetota bacterium]
MPGGPQEEDREPLVEVTPPEGIPIGSRLVMRRFGTEVGIFAGSMATFSFNVNDKVGRDLAIATLSRTGLADNDEIAAAFGVHRNTVGRMAKKVTEGGVAALLPASPPPPVRTTLNDEARALIATHAATMAPRAITELIATECGIHISVSHVRRLARAWRQEHLFDDDPDPTTPGTPGGAPKEASANDGHLPEAAPGGGGAPTHPQAMAFPAAGEPPAMAPSHEPPVTLPASVRGRHIGLALFYPALAALGLVEAARECFSLKAAERFGVRAVTLSLFFLHTLGDSTVEAAKHLARAEFGALIGAGRAPCVKTLRRKLAELVPQKMAGRFLERLSAAFVGSGMLDTAYLYVDGHLQVYTGKAKLAHQWSTRQRIACRGLMRYFVNDAKGRPLLFVPGELSGSLAKALPAVVEAVREVLGDRPFTLVFDRGGYDAKLFAWLRREEIDFITYQKGDPALPKEAFCRREVRFEGKRVRFSIAQDEVTLKGTGPWRRVVVRTKSGHQTPILTSLGTEVPPARIACLMFARWRQENFFRYLRTHLGIDALVSYAFGGAPGEALVPNPERKAFDRQIADKKKELSASKALLGEALYGAQLRGSGGLRGIRAAESETLGAIEALEAGIELLKDRRWCCPTHVPLAEAGTERDVALLEAKTIVDAIKIASYNAEEWLTERLAHHYGNPHDIRDLLRHFAHLSGEITTTSGGVTVRLDAPDTPAHRRALEGLCHELNVLRAPFPGTRLPVSYRVAVHQARVAA